MVKHKPVDRLLLLLAGSGMTETELREVLSHIKDTPIRSIVERVLRLDPNAVEMASVVEDEVFPYRPVKTSAEPDSTDVLNAIERLLVEEAGLTKSAAAFALHKWLQVRHPKRVVPAYQSKDGFAKWIRQLAGTFSLSELLHAASSIRNRRAHGQGDDWLDNN
jgi:hypothetical protein